MKKIVNHILIFTAAVLFIACSKTSNDPSSKVDIYVAGNLGTDTSYRAVYWKNGVQMNLSLSFGAIYSTAYSIAVSGSDVYVAGLEMGLGPEPAAVYWKNGEPRVLTDGATAAQTTGIAVIGSDIYVLGYRNTLGSYGENYAAVCWKNGNPIYLSDSTVNTIFTTGICVSGSDVYESGSISGYWKNENEVKFTNVLGSVSCIAVSGSDIYLGGQSGIPSAASYWKNGNLVILPEPQGADERTSSVAAIAIFGSNVYAAGPGYGGVYNDVARYWVNGKRFDIDNNNYRTYLNAIAVDGFDVYVAGARFNPITGQFSATYWKNGKAVDLTNSSHEMSYGFSIFLTKN